MKFTTLSTLGILASLIASPLMASESASKSKLRGTIEIEDITAIEPYFGTDFVRVENPRINWRSDRDGEFSSAVSADPIGEAEVILDRIIAIGDKIWKIIDKNKPVVTTQYQALSMIPQGATRWDQLETWAVPETRVYRMTYKNIYGMTVVDFAFRVAFTYGGSVNGKGKYLANIEIEPRALDVAWGYKFTAIGQILNPTNAGTKSNPMAASEIRMNWQINTVFKHSEESNRFYVRGDGLFKNLSNGTLPAR